MAEITKTFAEQPDEPAELPPVIEPTTTKEAPPTPPSRPSADLSESNIMTGKRTRKPVQRWVHEDEEEVLLNSSYNSEAYEEAERSDTEITQSDDEEEQEQIANEVADSDDLMSEDEEEEEEEDEWNPDIDEDDDDDDDIDDDEDDYQEEATVMLFKFDEDGRLAYHIIDEDKLVVDSSIDHWTMHNVRKSAVKYIKPQKTILVSFSEDDVDRLLDVITGEGFENDDRAENKSKLLAASALCLKANFYSVKAVWEDARGKKIRNLIENKDLLHYFFFE
jgi:hypothetical protein